MKRRRFLTVTVGVMVLSAGLMLMSVNRGAQAAPPASNPGNPFQAILDKLDQVLAAITGGGAAGNHTLRWDTNNPSATRFTVLAAIPGAVLDNNTGLVWEQAPDITGGPNFDGARNWGTAAAYCVNAMVGGTKGWRLPSVVELASLMDPANSSPTLPTGHPFSIVLSNEYWSASTVAVDPTDAWAVNFNNSGIAGTRNKTTRRLAWCVRGGMNADAY
jgi:Protein of unknown function (DUF1566)